jgi:hypothetical protein
MRTSAASVVTAVVLATACGNSGDKIPVDTAASVATAPAPVVAGTFTLDDFRRLRWLDGRWRGFQPDGNKFYEQYRWLNDSTMAMHAYSDSTFTMASDSSRVELRGGTVSNESPTARWVATRLDSTGVDFGPHHGAANHFTWAQESPTKWNATLRWTDKNGRPQTVVYALHRFGR